MSCLTPLQHGSAARDTSVDSCVLLRRWRWCFQGVPLCAGPAGCCRGAIARLPSGGDRYLLSLSLIGLGLVVNPVSGCRPWKLAFLSQWLSPAIMRPVTLLHGDRPSPLPPGPRGSSGICLSLAGFARLARTPTVACTRTEVTISSHLKIGICFGPLLTVLTNLGKTQGLFFCFIF